ncbi:MAG: hypothetical protein QM207_02200 [Thermobispora sp.]|nr:hypothetical protein [Thermobispora sp.]
MPHDLLGWLTALGEDRLARILVNRPDAMAPPRPRDLGALAARLIDDVAVLEVIRDLPLPALELIQARLALDGPAGEARLAAFTGVRTGEVRRWLHHLYDRAIAWPGPGGRIVLAPAVARWCPAPLGLGRPFGACTRGLAAEDLRRAARLLGVPVRGGRERLAARIRAVLGDPDRLGALLTGAPGGTLELLDAFAWDGPVRSLDRGLRRPGTPLDRCLLVLTRGDVAEMPREVALALRGPGHRAPFTPDPPDAALTEVDPDEVAHGMRRAAELLIERVSAFLGHLGASPVRTLHRGDIRADEVRRLAAAIGCPADEARVIAEVAAEAGLLSAAGGARTGARQAWRTADGPARLRLLLSAWWRMERSPLSGHGRDAGETVARIRRAIFGVLAGIPEGRCFASLPELIQTVRWRAPLLDRELVAGLTPAILAEAGVLGLVAGGALTELGRALAPLATGHESPPARPAAEHAPELVRASALDELPVEERRPPPDRLDELGQRGEAPARGDPGEHGEDRPADPGDGLPGGVAVPAQR